MQTGRDCPINVTAATGHLKFDVIHCPIRMFCYSMLTKIVPRLPFVPPGETLWKEVTLALCTCRDAGLS